MEMPDSIHDEIISAVESKDFSKLEKLKSKARKMGVDEKDLRFTITDGFEEYFDLSKLNRKLTLEEDFSVNDIYSGLGNNCFEVEMEFKGSPYLDEKDALEIGEDLADQAIRLLNLGLFKPEVSVKWDVESTHDFDGIDVVYGNEWGNLSVVLSIPVKTLTK